MINKSKFHSSLCCQTMCRTQCLLSISHKMLLGPVKAHQNQCTTGGAALQRHQQQTPDWPITHCYHDRDCNQNMSIRPRRQVLHYHRHTATQCLYHLEMQKNIFNINLFTLYALISHYRNMKKCCVNHSKYHHLHIDVHTLIWDLTDTKANFHLRNPEKHLLIAHRHDNEQLWGKKIANFS